MDAIGDPDTQQSVRMADCTSLRSAFVHAMKFESTRLSSRVQLKSVRVASAEVAPSISDSYVDAKLDEVIERLRTVIANQPRRTSQALCWACGRSGHLRNECPRKTRGQNASTAP
ncbi:hypothetical protein JGF61_23305, partial [Salmonella enterica subsp. enterica serovar Agona]|nr:hypothetical protein [Salmonella enterica subsp. enterica serovar Agona]